MKDNHSQEQTIFVDILNSHNNQSNLNENNAILNKNLDLTVSFMNLTTLNRFLIRQ